MIRQRPCCSIYCDSANFYNLDLFYLDCDAAISDDGNIFQARLKISASENVWRDLKSDDTKTVLQQLRYRPNKF